MAQPFEDELPVGWGDVVAVVVDAEQDGWALFSDRECGDLRGGTECVVEQVAADLDEVIRIAPDLSGGDSTRVDGGGSSCAALRLVEHDVVEVDERVRDLGLSVGVVLSSEQQEVVDHPRYGEVFVGDVGCDRCEDVRVLVAERSARTS